MSKPKSPGTCGYCGRVLGRSGMTRHLTSCPRRAERLADAARSAKKAEGRFLHFEVRDAWSGEYWLHLEMPESATLEALDIYLRGIWLECCGHMSQFSIGGPWGGREVGMDQRVGRAFGAVDELTHVYDFGTESVSRVRLVGERWGAGTTKRPVALMARNDPLDFRCMECDAAATSLCMECVYDDQSGMLCGAHAENHRHDDDEEELMPVVNSPRMGVCGYTGPATPPY